MPLTPQKSGSHPIASASPVGASHGSHGLAGKSITIQSPSRMHVSHPLCVWKRAASSCLRTPVSHSTSALASVAWPQSFTSIVGVNQRSEKPPSMGCRNAVSERFISRATSFIQISSTGSGSRQTAAGLP